ncbi:MAG TPA: hypothetical protein VGK70_09935 [Thermoanaerobaculia bacterium]
MSLIAWILLTASFTGPCAPQKSEARLSELVAAVRSADYRGDRAALDRLDAALGKIPDSALDDYRSYWRGFARWRRALNGFNETPRPPDLASDVEAALGHFRAALERRPGWIEARLAMAGCWGNLIYLAGDDAAKRQAILAEAIPAGRTLQPDAPDNPRVLWIIGGIQLSAPPPTGGDPVKAAATLRRGVECAWREALAGAAPGWVPVWGGAENLMMLAYVYSQTALSNKAAALAYAQGALIAAPEWHYVRDILLPQIEAMPEPTK